MTLTVLVGNPKADSRTLQVAGGVAAHVAGGSLRPHAIDLARHASEVHAWPSAAMDDALSAVVRSKVVVVASPTYKGAYSGLLKSFLDRLPHRGLSGVVAVPVMTGDRPEHTMAAETMLRPLLVELGAVVPVKSLYFPMARFDDLAQVIDEWATDNSLGVPMVRAALD